MLLKLINKCIQKLHGLNKRYMLALHFVLFPLMKVNCNDEDVVCQHSSMKIRYSAVV